jgi:hypothetical protein
MNLLSACRQNLSAETKAYGYTLSIWGSGALLITFYKSLTVSGILWYVSGGVLGFALLALLAFRGIFRSVENSNQEQFIVASMIHIFASLGNVFVSYLIILALYSQAPRYLVFLLVGIHASFSYNIFLLVEEFLSEKILWLEARIADELERGETDYHYEPE